MRRKTVSDASNLMRVLSDAGDIVWHREFQMKLIARDYSLSLFREAISSVVGLILTFFATCFAAIGLAAFTVFLVDLAFGRNEGLAASDALAFAVGLPIFWFLQAIVGVFQAWGLLSYGILAVLFLLYVREDRPASRLLPAAFLIQWLEFLRCTFQLGNWERVGTPGVIAALGLWVALCATWVVFLVRSHMSKPLLS